MSAVTKKNTSRRIVKITFTLSLFTFIFGIFSYLLSRYLELNFLANFHLISAFLFLLCAFLAKKVNVKLARILFFILLNLGITITASFIGRAGNVEYLYMYSLALPFFMFSFKTEKKFVYFFSCLSGLLWIILNITDFNLFTENHLDQEIAASFVYPIVCLCTIFLVIYQLVYFSLSTIKYNSKIYSKKDYALEASEAKSKFLSTMSHEIRTPLNAVIGLSHILGDSKPRKDQVDNIEALNYSGKILLNLLNNVLDFSKMQYTSIQLDNIPTNIPNAVKQIKKIHEASCLRKGITMNVRIDENIPIVSLDIVRYNQVINNLISNAVKFTDNGTVTLIIRKKKTLKNKIILLTEVRDTGIGIEEDKLDKIWEPFAQASHTTNRIYGGTGLGLPIVKSIVNAMNSRVKTLSKVGKGSRFYFDIILDVVEDHEHQNSEKKKEYNFSGKSVLLVDDNLINVMVGKQILEKAKFKVVVANDGLTAVKKMKEEPFDIVLMDLQMPIMDGYTATIEIRKFDTKTPILALSAALFMEVKDKINDCGMNGYIFKPFNPDDFLNEVENFTKNV